LSEVPTSHPEGLLCSRASSNSDKWPGHEGHQGHEGHEGHKGHEGHEGHGGIEGQELPRRLQGGQGDVGPLSSIHNNRHFILAIGPLQN